MTAIRLIINGRAINAEVEPRTHLADFLRDHRNMTATHLRCEQGACGACTVLIDGQPARSCITYTAMCEGAEITTIEGLAKDGNFHPLQGAFHREHGLQCGFCTPGMLIVALDFLRINPSPTEEEVREAMSAVICRCTGYRNIVRAVVAAAEIMRAKR